MPAPVVRRASLRSCTRTLQPRCASAAAAVSPAKPAPAISAWRRLRMEDSDIVQHAALDEADERVEDDADDGQQQNGIEHHGGVGLTLAIGDEKSKSGIAADELADGHADDRERRADA